MALVELPKDQWTLLHAVRHQAAAYGARVFCTFHKSIDIPFQKLRN